MSRDPEFIAAGIRVLEHYRQVELKKLNQHRLTSPIIEHSTTERELAVAKTVLRVLEG